MPLFRFDSAVILFIHVPKTGGSSIEAALRAMGGRPALLSQSSQGYARSTPQHMQAEVLAAFVPETFYDLRFALVRDPQSRLVSEYKMRRIGRERQDLPPLSFAEWVTETFERYQRNAYVFDNHIRPQSALIPEGTPVFRFEDGLAPALAHVADRLGRAAPALPHLREGARDPVPVPPETARRIADFYAEDYARFGYAPPPPQA